MGRLRDLKNAILGRSSLSVVEMKKMVSAAFYAATSDSPTMDFSFARDAGINQALLSDLQKLRYRCRYELKQNGVAKGIPRIYANSVVGRGPRLSLEGGDPTWCKTAEKKFAKWARSCDMMGGGSLGLQVHQSCRQLFSAGEYFLVPRSSASGQIRLQYLSIRPDRVKDPLGAPNGIRLDNGVEVNADGIPIAYFILKEDPDNNQTILPQVSDFDRVPAEKIIHVFYREEPVQHRGEPWMATSLPVWHKMRRYDEATIAAAIVAAKFAAVLVNLNPAAVEDSATILPPTVLDIQDGQMMVPPPGYEPRQIDPKHPSSNSSDFRRDQIGAAGAATAMPVNIASQDSSKSNFSSARFDGVSFAQEGAVAREMIETLHLNRVWQAWIREAMAAGVVPEIDLEDPETAPAIEWLWIEENRHSDPAKQASAEETRLKSSTSTVGQIVMEKGIDRQQFRDALLEEVTWYRENDLTHPLDAQTPSAGRPPEQGAENEA